MSKYELAVWTTQDFPRGWTHIIKGSFADPQFATKAATDVFCYDQNTGVGAFFATVKNGRLDDGTPVPDGLHKVGENHTFDRRWTYIVHFMATVNIIFNPIPDPLPPTPIKIHVPVLLFYDGVSGVGEFYRTEGRGDLIFLKQYSGWRTSWTKIIPGRFGKATLLFYDAANGTGEFYAVNFSDNHPPKELDIKIDMRLVRSFTNWRSSWHSIIPGNFSSNSIDDLLFYDKGAGVGEFYKLDNNSGMTLFGKHENWRQTWQHVVSGRFTPDSNLHGLLFFEEGSGTIEFYSADGHGNIFGIDVDPGNQIRLPWQAILAGNFVPNLGLTTNSSLCTYHPDGAIRYFYFQLATIETVIDLNGKWTDGTTRNAEISASYTFLSIDMSAYHRPPASGSILDSSTIRVTFPDDATYTGKLELPNKIRWSNNSVWTKI